MGKKKRTATGGNNQKVNAERINTRQRDRQILELRKGGANYETIGRHFGISRQRAHQIATRELAAITMDTAKELKDLDLTRLDRLLAAHWRVLPQAEEAAVNGDLRPLIRLTSSVEKIMTRRARLCGLDAPAKVAPTTPDGQEEYLGDAREQLTRLIARHAATEQAEGDS